MSESWTYDIEFSEERNIAFDPGIVVKKGNLCRIGGSKNDIDVFVGEVFGQHWKESSQADCVKWTA